MNIKISESLDLYGIAIIAVLLLLIFITIALIKNTKKLNILKNKYDTFMKGSSGADLDAVIEKCFSNIEYLESERNRIKNEINEIKLNITECIQNVGVKRFNAFENVGSDLSFAIALLDDNFNGVIISSIFTRETSTAYAKPIIGGKSKYTLSEEEIDAINTAKKHSITLNKEI